MQDVFQQKLQDPVPLETHNESPERNEVTGSLDRFDPVTSLRYVPGFH